MKDLSTEVFLLQMEDPLKHKDVVFGTSDLNLTTLEADIFRGIITTDLSDTSKAIFSLT